MSVNNLSKFKRLFKAGLGRKQIIEKMGISPRTYTNYKNRMGRDSRRCEIDPKKYYIAVMNSYATKDELAAKLEISKPTLIKFEKDNRTIFRLCRAAYVQGGAAVLAGMLHITPETARKHTAGITTLAGIARGLKIAIGIIEDSAEYDPDANATIRTISNALDLLESVKSKAFLQLQCKSNDHPIY